MKFLFVCLAVLSTMVLSNFAVADGFSVDSKTCQLFRVIDLDHVNSNSELVNEILRSKGYQITEINSLEEAKKLPEDTFWGMFDFETSVEPNCYGKINSCAIMVSFYHVFAPVTESERDKLMVHSKSTRAESSFRVKNLCAGIENDTLGMIPECHKVP